MPIESYKPQTRQEFNELIQRFSNQWIVVKCSAPWCGPCRRIQNDFESMYLNHKPSKILIEVNVDEQDDVSAYLKVRSIPVFISYKDGNPHSSCQGANLENLQSFFDRMR